MDAIRKKMQSLKGETESLYATIRRFEEATAEYSARADQVSNPPLLYQLTNRNSKCWKSIFSTDFVQLGLQKWLNVLKHDNYWVGCKVS